MVIFSEAMAKAAGHRADAPRPGHRLIPSPALRLIKRFQGAPIERFAEGLSSHLAELGIEGEPDYWGFLAQLERFKARAGKLTHRQFMVEQHLLSSRYAMERFGARQRGDLALLTLAPETASRARIEYLLGRAHVVPKLGMSVFRDGATPDDGIFYQRTEHFRSFNERTGEWHNYRAQELHPFTSSSEPHRQIERALREFLKPQYRKKDRFTEAEVEHLIGVDLQGLKPERSFYFAFTDPDLRPDNPEAIKTLIRIYDGSDGEDLPFQVSHRREGYKVELPHRRRIEIGRYARAGNVADHRPIFEEIARYLVRTHCHMDAGGNIQVPDDLGVYISTREGFGSVYDHESYGYFKPLKDRFPRVASPPGEELMVLDGYDFIRHFIHGATWNPKLKRVTAPTTQAPAPRALRDPVVDIDLHTNVTTGLEQDPIYGLWYEKDWRGPQPW
jgi:hypothetical protein